MKKLYRVDVEWSYYVLAEDEDDAITQHYPKAAADVTHGLDVCYPHEVVSADEPLADDWDPTCGLYGGDLTLGEALDALRQKKNDA